MKKLSKRMLASLAALALLLPLLGTGCGPKPGGPNGGSTKAEQTKAPEQETGGKETEKQPAGGIFNAEGLPILNEKKTFKVAVHQTSPLKAAAERNCVIETEKLTNVAIDWVEIPRSAWKEKINVMFSTDSLPDAIIGGIDMARNYEMLAPLDELLEKYAPHTTAFFAARDDYPAALRAPDGTVRCLPIGDESIHNMFDSQYWINVDWLKKLGLEIPQTTEEFKQALIAFRDQDPNGNGEKDEIPFTFESTWSWANAIDNMFGAFGVVEHSSHVFLDKDNKVIFSPTQQGYFDALSWLHELYAEGLVDDQIFTISEEQYMARSGGKDIIGSFAGYFPDTCGVDKGENGDRYQAMPPLKGPSGQQMIGANNITREGGFAISAKCEMPEVFVRWYDTINSSLEMACKWGRGNEGEWWKIENDKPVFLTMDSKRLEELGYKTKPEYRNAESFAGQTPALWKVEFDKDLSYDENWPHDWKRDAVNAAMPFAVKLLPAGTASAENTERRALLLVDMDTYLKKFISDSVINGIDQAKWEKHLETMKQLKAEEYTALCQEFADSMK